MLSTSPRQLMILRLLRESGRLTRAEIGAKMGLSASQVSRLTSDLLAGGLIEAERQQAHASGRPSDYLTLAREGRFVAGVDLGGSIQHAVLLTLGGETVARCSSSRRLTADLTVLLDHLEWLVASLLDDAQLSRNDLLGLGVGVRGIVNPIRGTVSGIPETGSTGELAPEFSLRDAIVTRLPVSALTIDDTVRAIGVAEARMGQASGESDFLYVIADTGIGVAIMIDGRPYLGPSRVSGEIGHIVIEGLHEPCGCGRIGCLETASSVGAVVRNAHRIWPGRTWTIESLITASESGDLTATELLATAGTYLGHALAAALNLLGPNLIVIGGRLSTSQAYIDAVTTALFSRGLPQALDALEVRPSSLDAFAGAVGAATMALDDLFSIPGDQIKGTPLPSRQARHRATVAAHEGGDDGRPAAQGIGLRRSPGRS